MGKKQQQKHQPTATVLPVEKSIQKTKQEVLALRSQRIELIRTKLLKLITLDTKQIKKATTEILKYRQTQKQNDLLDIKDDFIYLEIVLNRVPIKFSIRPIQIKLPYPIYSQEMNTKFCIISNNPQRALKDKIADFDIPLIQKVIGYNKLKKNYPTYADKRKLFYEYDQFFCDQTVYSGLSKSLGKIFYERKKIPFPIDGDSNEAQLQELGNFTYFMQGNGPVYTVKIGRAAQTPDQITKNVNSVVFDVLPFIMQEKGMNLACLRQMSLKLSNSVSLPFFNRLSVREVEVSKK